MIYIVTAVTRPDNLPRIHRSIEASLQRSGLRVTWILVIDRPDVISPEIERSLKCEFFEVVKILYPGGSCPYGISQKNFGMDLVKDGFFHCLDDDNLVHPLFFSGLERAMKAQPSKRAFVITQQRWDSLQKLVASPDRMGYGQIDNTMFVVHSSLIGSRRYDVKDRGREDFLFFNYLWSLYREEFVFIPDPIVYYNYLRYFPSESPQEPIRMINLPPVPVKRVVDPAPVTYSSVAPLPKAPGVLKIALYSSKRDRCGIATYTYHLENALIAMGHDVQHWGSQRPYGEVFGEISAWKPDILHLQHETSIMPGSDELASYASQVRSSGARILITLHTENEATAVAGRKAVGDERMIVVHRPTSLIPKATVIPMPCPLIGTRATKSELREKFGFPKDAFVLSTVGFMIPWKNHPELIGALLPWLSGHPDVYLQVIASEHFSRDLVGYAELCRRQILSISSRLPGGRIRHIDQYPSDLELVERLTMSDLGYVWCPFDTGSSSAAAAQFTTAKCPLVATDSTHYGCLGTGIVRSAKKIGDFVELIGKTAESQELLSHLRANQWEMYHQRNYIETARRHLELYGDRNGA